MNTIKIDDFGLTCPDCGNKNLHLGTCLPYEEGYLLVIRYCEHCDFSGALYIYFHEGSIYLEWLK